MDYTLSSPHAQRGAAGVGLFISIAVITMACGTADRRSPTDGTLTDTTYENTYFGFSLPLPAGWSVATPQAEDYFREVGQKAIAGDDPLLQASVEASVANTFQLLTVSEHPVGAAVAFNPMIVVMAESVSHAPGIKTGADYLFHLGNVLERSPIAYETIGEVSAIELGGRSFHRKDFGFSSLAGVRQSYIFAREGEYVFGFVLSAQDQNELEGLLGLVSQIRFH